MMQLRALAVLLSWAALVWALPLLGLLLAGQPIAEQLGFPPRPGVVPHAAFSWLAFALYALPVAGSMASRSVERASPWVSRRAPGSHGGAGSAYCSFR
jgi:hypothetical protein